MSDETACASGARKPDIVDRIADIMIGDHIELMTENERLRAERDKLLDEKEWAEKGRGEWHQEAMTFKDQRDKLLPDAEQYRLALCKLGEDPLKRIEKLEAERDALQVEALKAIEALAEARRDAEQFSYLLHRAVDMLHECGLRDEIWVALEGKP
jgi:hypothetical protein